MQLLFSTLQFTPSLIPTRSIIKVLKPLSCFCSSSSNSPLQLTLLESIESDSLITLEWPAICRQLIPFASTSMAKSLAARASIPMGASREESQILLDQTGAALAAILDSGPPNLSSIEDITRIVDSAVSGQLLTIRELCSVRWTLNAARETFELLTRISGDGDERSSSLVKVLEECNFQTELEEKIGFCIDGNLSVILNRASEELEIIRSERKQNMENLDSLLKSVSSRIFQEGGIDRPLVTKRRSRLCVGVRATHKFLIPAGVVLDASSSGATYFMEPAEAVELNNMEVLLRDSERNEEVAILSLLTSEIAQMSCELKFLLDSIIKVDLAFARAAHARWLGGSCPIWTTEKCDSLQPSQLFRPLSVDIEGICHPILLESSYGLSSTFSPTSSVCSEENGVDNVGPFRSTPVPISIKVEVGTKVVVISGPNTGGKTASMKTLGIASLMSKAGFYLPAKHSPKLPWFDLVLADIGDHQSLEQSLSTFSGHISRICKILDVATENSLVLIDEICSGTDPSEGVALSTSILQYMKNRVNLAIVTTHYADLSRLKDQDNQFENAAMQFSLETLLPTFQILWGSTGNSNALSIAKSLDFDDYIIQRAQMWVDKLNPELQQERRGLLYQSLLVERDRLEEQAIKVSSLHADILKLYLEIKAEAEDLEIREKALMSKESRKSKQMLEKAKLQIHKVVQDFEKELRLVSPDKLNSLLKKAQSEIASIVETHKPKDYPTSTEPRTYTLEPGEQVYVKSLGGKIATVVKSNGDEEEILVQYGLGRVRVKKTDVTPAKTENKAVLASTLKKQVGQLPEAVSQDREIPYSPRIQTSKNTVDLRGMRAEEASRHLYKVISSWCTEWAPSVIFVVHGVGTGAVRQSVENILGKHPRVAKYEPESPLNYGCTVVYIKLEKK